MQVKRNLVKRHYSYTTDEISRLLKVHVRTVQRWVKMGLPIIDPKSKPYLIKGQELKHFLKKVQASRKTLLENDQFFCLRCRCGRNSKPDSIEAIYTNKIIGKDQHQVILNGICCVCGSKIRRFTSAKKFQNSGIATAYLNRDEQY